MVSLPVVLLIFISSKYPRESVNEGTMSPPPTAQPEKGFVDSGKSPKVYNAKVNDLTAVDFRFPDSPPRGVPDKVIQEKVVSEEKKEKNKTPVPLYSLVKNNCGEGYALDENGVCQKTIAVRSEKKFDSDKRRKRHILSYEWMTQIKSNRMKSNENGSQKAPVECSHLYPGLVANENGGCKKAIKSLKQTFDKTLPP